jgi:ssDNA-specific exonuclease RecJ
MFDDGFYRNRKETWQLKHPGKKSSFTQIYKALCYFSRFQINMNAISLSYEWIFPIRSKTKAAHLPFYHWTE